MENGIWVKEDYKLYTVKYGLINICKETYRPHIS